MYLPLYFYLNSARDIGVHAWLRRYDAYLSSLERSIERRVYKIFVGAIDADVPAYVGGSTTLREHLLLTR